LYIGSLHACKTMYLKAIFFNLRVKLGQIPNRQALDQAISPDLQLNLYQEN